MLYLKKLSPNDGPEIYKMLQEIAANDNGFYNKAYGMSYEQYIEWLNREYDFNNGINLLDWMVPNSSFWMYDGDVPIGYGRIRHCLNDSLRENSGHIGYAIRRSQRGKGYGNKILELLINECGELGIKQLQISANIDNIYSNKVIL